MKPYFSHFLSGACILLLSGCGSLDLQGHDPVDYYQENPIKNRVEEHNVMHTVRFVAKEPRLAPSEIDRLRSNMHGISPAAVQSVRVNVPVLFSKANERKTHLGKLLRSLGYSKGDIHFVEIANLPQDEVTLDFTYAIVVFPDCPDWKRSPTTTYSNTFQGNFHCAQEVNTGLMVADPYDLVQGKGMVAPDTGRGARAIENYRAGTSQSSSSESSSVTGGASESSGSSFTPTPQ